MSRLRNERYQVAAWGDVALWLVKNKMSAPETEAKFHILDDRQGPLMAVKALAADGELKGLAGICFTGLKDCRDLNVALGLAGLGLKTSIAVPIPIQGSKLACELLAELLGKTGGSLIHFERSARVQDILECFTA